jgi:ankyrin repeat protein
MANTTLMQAIASENVELVQILLAAEIKDGINDVYETPEITPLILAISKQNIDLIKLLLAKGAAEKINDPVKSLNDAVSPPVFAKKTPLQWAIETGNLDIVKILVENGAKDRGYGESKTGPA